MPWTEKWVKFGIQHLQKHFLERKFYILIWILLKFYPICMIDNKSTLVQVMVWCCQATTQVTWTNVDLAQWCHMTSQGHNELWSNEIWWKKKKRNLVKESPCIKKSPNSRYPVQSKYKILGRPMNHPWWHPWWMAGWTILPLGGPCMLWSEMTIWLLCYLFSTVTKAYILRSR